MSETGKHRKSAEVKATITLVRATYALAIATIVLVLVTAWLAYHTAEEAKHTKDCPVPAIVNERRIGE